MSAAPELALPGALVICPIGTPAGPGWIGIDGDRIVWLSIGDLDEATVRTYWKGPVRRAATCPYGDAALVDAARGSTSLPLAPLGTPFQQEVWRQLRRIPFATTTSYGELAAAIGQPGKARAVGAAVGANPVAWLIPCHRVLPAGGGLGGYRWGAACKERLLAWESAGTRDGAPAQPAEDKRRLEAMLLNAQRFEDITRLAGSIAHDLNNLLAPIRMATELLKRKSADPALGRYIEIIESSTGRARAVIQEILAFSKESETAQAQTIDVNPVLQELEKVLHETFPGEIAVNFEYQDNAPPVTIDPHQLHRAVLNLLVNARDAMGGRGRLQVRLSTHDLEMRVCVGDRCMVPGRYVCISVSDTGSGIPPEIRGRIFDPFFTTKPKEQGTGLGLASVFGIIARAGGFIDLESEVGKGSTFHLFLPEAGSRS